MQRYFIDENYINLEKGFAVIEGKDYHHIKDVMRMKIDDKVILCTSSNKMEYLARIDSLNQKVILSIISSKENLNELNCNVTIAQGLVRKDKIEEVVRRICELGATGYINLQMTRCNISLKKKEDYKITRLETIVKEASEQSERGRLLELFGYKSFKEFITFSSGYDYKFVCYEEVGRKSDDLSNSLYNYVNNLQNKNVIVLVGPEGGITENEIVVLKENGYIPIGLGKRILRTETAPLMVMSIISSYIDYLGANYEK